MNLFSDSESEKDNADVRGKLCIYPRLEFWCGNLYSGTIRRIIAGGKYLRLSPRNSEKTVQKKYLGQVDIVADY